MFRLTTHPLAVLLLAMPVAASVPRGPRSGDRSNTQVGPDTVIARILDAYGGVAAIRAVEAYREEGMLVAVRAGAHGRLYRVSRGAGELSVLVEYADRSEYRILEGASALRGPTAGSLAEVTGPLKASMVLQAARAWLPRILDDRAEVTEVAGSADGRTILDVRIAADLVLRVFVDDETGLIVRSESILGSPQGPFGFATDYADFRPVAGVLFPFREETFASGFHTGSTVLESVEVNPVGDRARLPGMGGL